MAPPPDIRIDPLPYEGALGARDAADIELVVVHCTELPDLAVAREYGERVLYAAHAGDSGGTGNSGHYYIDRDGSIHRWVAHERIAHHVRGHNARSLGIELVNTGRYPHWLHAGHQQMAEDYPDAQVDALIALLRQLRDELPALRTIAGHEDLDTDEVEASNDPALRVRRKQDPGPRFPWARVLESVSLKRILE